MTGMMVVMNKLLYLNVAKEDMAEELDEDVAEELHEDVAEELHKDVAKELHEDVFEKLVHWQLLHDHPSQVVWILSQITGRSRSHLLVVILTKKLLAPPFHFQMVLLKWISSIGFSHLKCGTWARSMKQIVMLKLTFPVVVANQMPRLGK